jgi:hypothetical protein
MVYFKGKKPKLSTIDILVGNDYIWCGSHEGWVKIDKYGGQINRN